MFQNLCRNCFLLSVLFNFALSLNTTTTIAPKLETKNVSTPVPFNATVSPTILMDITTTEIPAKLTNLSTKNPTTAQPFHSETFKKLLSTVNLKSNQSEEFVIPKAIRVIPDGEIEMLYNKIQEQPKPKLEDNIEESFTYQVKRQNRDSFSGKSFDFKSPWGNVFEKQNPVKSESKEEHELILKKITDFNKKLLEVESKLSKTMEYLSLMDRKQNLTMNTTNSTINEVKLQLKAMNESMGSHSNSVQEVKRTFSSQKDMLEGQIQTLAMHLRHLKNQTYEQNLQGTKKLEHVLSVVQNASHEIRLNEVRTRYNQKALTSLDRLVQANNEKIVEMSTPESGPKWTEQTSGCGGILIAEEGVISYKFRQPYLNNERCIWTIRSNRRSRIVLQLLEDGFQNSSNSDYITVTEFSDDQPSSLVTSSRIEHGNRAIHTFRGPLIFLTFYSDSVIPGNGFTLKFKGAGNVSAADALNAVRYRHTHLKEPIGHLTYPEEKNLLYQPNEIATFVVNPTSTSTKVYLRYTDLEKEESCEYDSVNFYGSVMASFALAKKYCEQQQAYSGESLQSSDGTFIVVFRSDASTQFKGFQFSWETL